MLNFIKRLVHEEEGQGLVEYGLIIVFVAIAAIVGVTVFGGDVSDFFENLADKVGFL